MLATVMAAAAANEALLTDGHVIVPVLTPSEVDRLHSWFDQRRPVPAGQLVMDYLDRDRTLMQETADVLRPVLGPHLTRLFPNHRVLVVTMVAKGLGAGSDMLLHHEPTYVEPPTRTWNVWIPLVDVGPAVGNGTIELVPGTEGLPFGLVGTQTPVGFREYESFLRRFSLPLDVPAGWAAVYDSRTLHHSAANRSGEVRSAIAAVVAPADEPLRHVVATGRRSRTMFEIDERFFIDLHPYDIAESIDDRYPALRTIKETPRLRPDEVADAVGADGAPEPTTVVPGDVAGMIGAVPGSPSTRLRRRGIPSRDIGRCARDVEIPLDPTPGLEFQIVRGIAALGRLEDARGRDHISSAAVRDIRQWHGRRDADLVVLDPGARVMLDSGRRTPTVAVYECPMVNAGLLGPEGAVTFEPGTLVETRADGRTLLWNDGPGSAWLVITRGRARRRPSARRQGG